MGSTRPYTCASLLALASSLGAFEGRNLVVKFLTPVNISITTNKVFNKIRFSINKYFSIK